METKAEYESLLEQAREYYNEEIEQYENDFNTGKYFNVFHVFGKSNDEVNIHSRFLTMLLNPSESHGCGEFFLKKFLQKIKLYNTELNLRTAKIYSEYDIGLLSDDGENGGRLDILIKFDSDYAIIIENKIDAYDQANQLMRYKNFADKVANFSTYDILYLTKNGHDPDIETDNPFWKNISYEEHIIPWLQACLVNPLNKKTNIVSTIRQYITTLEEILDIDDDFEFNTNFEKLFVSSYNLRLIQDISERIFETKESILKDFFENYVKEHLKKSQIVSSIDYQADDDVFRRLWCTRNNWKFYIVIELNLKNGILKQGIVLKDENSVQKFNGNKLNSIRNKIRKLPSIQNQNYKTKHSWWVVWKYFEDDYEFWTSDTYIKIKDNPEDLYLQIYGIVNSYVNAFKGENFFNKKEN